MTAPSPSPFDDGAIVPSLELKIVYVDPKTIEPAGRQLKLHPPRQMKALERSIGKHGFTVPLLVDGEGRLLAGHARLKAAIALGMTRVPTIALAHMSEVEKRAFVISESRIGELAGWDRQSLAAEMQDLSKLDPTFDLTITGFSAPEVDALSFSMVLGDDADAPELMRPQAKAVSRLGDIWLLGEHRLMCGDALNDDMVEQLVGSTDIRLVSTDPPYNIPASVITKNTEHRDFVQGSGELSEEEFSDFLTRTFLQASRVLRKGGLAYFFMDWRHVHNMVDALRGSKLELINICVWGKDVAGQGSFYRSQHELAFVTRKGGGPHMNRVELGTSGRSRSNLWTYPGMAGFGLEKSALRSLHSTVKPEQMIRDIILDCTQVGDEVLDLFSGSGTTLIAAERSRRRGRAIELDPLYVDVGIRRFEAVTGKIARHARTGMTLRETAQARSQETVSPHHPPARVRSRALGSGAAQ